MVCGCIPHPKQVEFLSFRGTCQADSLVYCITCTRCGDKFVGETARTLDKRFQVSVGEVCLAMSYLC